MNAAQTESAQRLVASPHFRWMPGMRTIGKGRIIEGAGCLGEVLVCDEYGYFEERIDRVALIHFALELPDLDDPATIGCLLAIAAELENDPSVMASICALVESIISAPEVTP